MATRFYLPAEGTTNPYTTPSITGSWEQTGQATVMPLQRSSRLSTTTAMGASSNKTIPITTTQDVLAAMFLSEPIPPQTLRGTVSLVVSALQSVTTANATLAVSVSVYAAGGTAFRGTLFSVFGTDTAFATTQSTRIITTQPVTTTITQPGDFLIVEIGARATAPTTTSTFSMRFGSGAASDFALTSALTTDLRPWIEFSQNIWSSDTNNYQFVKVGDGMSTGERIR